MKQRVQIRFESTKLPLQNDMVQLGFRSSFCQGATVMIWFSMLEMILPFATLTNLCNYEFWAVTQSHHSPPKNVESKTFTSKCKEQNSFWEMGI